MRERSRPALLIVEDDPGLAKQLKWAFADDWTVALAGDRAEAVAEARRLEPAVAIVDLGLPPDPNGCSEGLAAMEEILAANPLTKVIVATGFEERSAAVEAVRLGAYDFHAKPVDLEVLALVASRAAHLHQLERENARLKAQAKGPLADVIAESTPMLELCSMIERVAPSDVSVLLTGESGTGKEVLARAVHQCSARTGEFVAINCAAIPDQLLESELFGHEKGAFTGAVKRTRGKVEQADGGTLFLDEIGDMPMALQAKLLRFLQERVVERVGGRETISVDVRVVAATNQDLDRRIEEGLFREDLFYRLDEVGLRVPPLRERPGDAVLLARHFLVKYAAAYDRPLRDFAPDAMSAIASYGWPGNVRELENKVKRAAVLAEGGKVRASDLGLSEADFPTLRSVRERAEEEAVARALAVTGDNVSAAAKLLGISRPTLYDLIKTLRLRA